MHQWKPSCRLEATLIKHKRRQGQHKTVLASSHLALVTRQQPPVMQLSADGCVGVRRTCGLAQQLLHKARLGCCQHCCQRLGARCCCNCCVWGSQLDAQRRHNQPAQTEGAGSNASGLWRDFNALWCVAGRTVQHACINQDEQIPTHMLYSVSTACLAERAWLPRRRTAGSCGSTPNRSVCTLLYPG
jgi:hypothetical protein